MDKGRLLYADHIDTDLQNLYFEGFTKSVKVITIFVCNV